MSGDDHRLNCCLYRSPSYAFLFAAAADVDSVLVRAEDDVVATPPVPPLRAPDTPPITTPAVILR